MTSTELIPLDTLVDCGAGRPLGDRVDFDYVALRQQRTAMFRLCVEHAGGVRDQSAIGAPINCDNIPIFSRRPEPKIRTGGMR